MRKKQKKGKNVLLVILFLFISIVIFGFIISSESEKTDKLSLLEKELELRNVPYKSVENKTLKIPANNSSYIQAVREIIIDSNIVIDEVSKLNNKIVISLKDDNDAYIGKIEFDVIRESKPIIQKEEKNYSKNKICIILDDGGYGNKNIYKLVKYPEKITIAVLPFLPKSKYVSQLVHSNGKEVMLHMPMEPKNYKKRGIRLFKNDLLSTMSYSEINGNITKMLKSVAYVKGVNNHQGSGLTENPEKMNIILNRLLSENLYFIDSLTSKKSVSYKIGRRIGVMVGKRDIFLDNKDDYNYIKSQMDKLIKISLRRGYAVGIGHVTRENTVKVLYDYIDIFREKGIKLVFPSELLNEIYNKEVI